MSIYDKSGAIGAFLLSCCGVPELYRSWKNKRCDVGWGFLNLWMAGEIMLLIYVIPQRDWILVFNYGLNVLICMGLVHYKIGGKNE